MNGLQFNLWKEDPQNRLQHPRSLLKDTLPFKMKLMIFAVFLYWWKNTVEASQGNCSFDKHFCEWSNEKRNDTLDWRRYKGYTPTRFTGPSHDVSGNGYYIFIRSVNGRALDKARLLSPPLHGSQCMTFYYNFYGSTMSCVVISIQTSDGSERILWIKSGHWGDRWFKTHIEISEEEAEYRIIIDGIRGRLHLGDAALDEISFVHGSCKNDRQVFHVVSKRKGSNEIYRVHHLPAHDQWLNKFQFTAHQIRRSQNDTMVFIYPASLRGKSILSTTLDLSDSRRFPSDFFIAKRNETPDNILELSLNSGVSRITISNIAEDCCLVNQTASFPVTFVPESKRSCRFGWIPIAQTCLRFFVNTRRTWDGARAYCRHQGGDLALLKNAILMNKELVTLLVSVSNSETDFFIGFHRFSLKFGNDTWLWNNGKNIDKTAWQYGYPRNDARRSCGTVSRHDGKLLNTDCTNMNGFICENVQVNVVKDTKWTRRQLNGQEPLLSPPDFIPHTPFFRNGLYNLRWIVTLFKRTFVSRVALDLFVSCCTEQADSVTMLVTNDDNHYFKCSEMSLLGTGNILLFQCIPPRSGANVILEFVGQSLRPASSLTVFAFDSVDKAHGVRRELWYRYVNTEGFTTLREHPIFDVTADGYTSTFNMSASFEVSDNYGERLTSYLQVPVSANYEFALSCGDECELWFKEFTEPELFFDTGLALYPHKQQLLVQLQRWASYRDSDTCLKKHSESSLYLSKCKLYALNVYMKEELQFKCLSVGMSGPAGIQQDPIQGDHLFSAPPGIRSLSFVILHPSGDMIKQVDLGSNLNITVSYKYCCQGMFCPDCPITLELQAFGRLYLVNSSVEMICTEHFFNKAVEVIAQPGMRSMEIHYWFTSDLKAKKGRRKIADIDVKVALITQLTFSKDYGDWTNSGWKISDGHALVDEAHNSHMESPLLSWKPFYKKVGLCLQFKYQLPTKFLSSLNVHIKTGQEDALIWKLKGHQGSKWNNAAVSWKPQKETRIVFEGYSPVNGTPSIIIDNITVTTEDCKLMPQHASPDFVCKPSQFQCLNGECISWTHHCDSDVNCLDGSDEVDCTCLISEFQCPSGACVSSDNLCDGVKHCLTGKDERSCGGTCSNNLFQCVDGTCIPWDTTCRQGKPPVCQDGSHMPSICGGYIYIEASQRQFGDRARLTSDWLHQNKLVCLQLWYHMFGKHIGQLNVYIATNTSETLIWSKAGNQGDHWMFAQIDLTAKYTFKFILEGVTFKGNMGDIAVDDVTVLEEVCPVISSQKSPHCYFDEGVCSWEVGKYWQWTRSYTRKTGGYLSFMPDSSNSKGTLVSPLLRGKDWRCMRFWYRIDEGNQAEIKVSVQSLNKTKQLWMSAHKSTRWSFVQLSVNISGTGKIVIEGMSLATLIHFDNVSFGAECCNEIPWAPYKEFLPPFLPGCLRPLGMQDGRIPDSSIKASSYYRKRSAPSRGRLHLAIPDSSISAGVTGGWCQSYRKNQWLQVDLGFVASVGKFATQGKQEHDFWVTKYYLGYRIGANGSFSFYQQNRTVKEFDGNFDRHTVVSHLLVPRITARFLRIYPLSYHQFGCLRVEYYGCPIDKAHHLQTPCYSPLGMQNGQITNASITASSNFGYAHRARLHTVKEGGKPGGWVAASADNTQWIQIDFGALVMARGLVTQGRHEHAEWVSSFALSYSPVGTNFKFYEVNSEVKIFPGNKDQHTVVENKIDPHILCRYLCIHPHTWVNNIALRIEIFGCLAVKINIKDIEDIGCYKDTPNRAIPLLDAMSPLVDGNYLQRAAAIRRCANFAYELQLKTFAVQNGGQCFGGPLAELTYKKYGPSVKCLENGRGGPLANQVYRIVPNCNKSWEWCNWTNRSDGTPMWRLSRADALVNTILGNKHDRCYVLEIHRDKHLQMNTLVKAPAKISELTICYWLHDSNSSLSITYNSAGNKQVISLQQDFKGLSLAVVDNTISSSLHVEYSIWHHICVTWSSHGGFWKIYKDGRLLAFDRGLSFGKVISETGVFDISFKQNNDLQRSRLCGVNIWDFVQTANQVYRLSLGCGEDTGNILQWSDLRSKANPNSFMSTLKTPPFKHRGLMTVASDNSEGEAVLESPMYNRSPSGYGMCLQFGFIMFGEGAKSLEIYQYMNQNTWMRIWKVSNNTIPHWRYGQVSFTSLTKSKVIVKGVVGNLPGLIAIGGISQTKGYCDAKPSSAHSKACSENVEPPGVILSPFHPGYYPPNSFCKWFLSAPTGHLVRLQVLDFQLQSNPLCKNDFLEVIDGPEPTAQSLGRFCGDTIPRIIESSGNTMLIIFKADKDTQRSGFKFLHSSREQTEDKICTNKRDCPSGCSCFKTSDNATTFAVKGYKLGAMPKTIPSYTTALLFANNRISQIKEKALRKLTRLEYLDLSHNVILVLADYSFQENKELKSIKLTANFIGKLNPFVFAGLESLQVLDLGENLLKEVPRQSFLELPSLRILSLRSNEIKTLTRGMFHGRFNLTYLYLQDNLIQSIPDRLFRDLRNLKVLYLNNNKIKRISMSTFEGLSSLKTMYLDKNKITDFSPETFHALANLRRLKMDHFTHCCYAVRTVRSVNCEAPSDGFSSCDDLMKNGTLQIFIWILGILAFCGNIIVVVWRSFLKEGNHVHSFLLTNLAISDFLMGVYLLIIATKDVQWQGEYFRHDLSWRRSVLCQFAGVLSMVSSEVSVAMLTIITADRLLCIVFPFRFKKISAKRVYALSALVWTIGVIISTMPLIQIPYFTDENSNYGFYGRSAVCLPLQLSSERPAGWEYSVSFFIALNFIAFMFMLVAYITMFITAKRVHCAVRSTRVRHETSMAGKMISIILTDFFCWMPVIIIGILSLTGKLYDPKQLVYVWIAVFVLPVNSAINPILYTFSTINTRKKMKPVKGTINSLINKRLPRFSETRGTMNQSEDVTLSSMVPNISDYRPSPGKLNLKIIEICHISHKSDQSIGYLTCWVEREVLEICLIKYFAKCKEIEWAREVQVSQEISKHGKHPNLMSYCWHSEVDALNLDLQAVKLAPLKKSGLLICFTFVSSTTLEEFWKESSMMCDAGLHELLRVMIDIIKAIEHLHKIGICHNDINPSNVLISFSEGSKPLAGVLGNFGKAFSLKSNDNWWLMTREDLKQFGNIMELVITHFSPGETVKAKVKEILLESNEEDSSMDASYVHACLQEMSSSSEETTHL
ncbi:uncharacterized protein [Montipora capricornis]|uniref:uncharacterized protein isoform X2 n=1 Tax=Montipora capricornis TaxID=246305 RepID=UPI0035F1668E